MFLGVRCGSKMISTIDELHFTGYLHGCEKDELLTYSSLFCVYACEVKVTEEGGEGLEGKRLLYIREGVYVRERVKGYEKIERWEEALVDGEELCYRYSGEIDELAYMGDDRRKCYKALLMFVNQLAMNVEHKKRFKRNVDLTLDLKGDIDGLHEANCCLNRLNAFARAMKKVAGEAWMVWRGEGKQEKAGCWAGPFPDLYLAVSHSRF